MVTINYFGMSHKVVLKWENNKCINNEKLLKMGKVIKT